MASQQPSESPYAKMRRRLFALCGQEFEAAPNIWLVYSSKTDRQWVLRSDLQYLHFLAIEFDAAVLTFDLAPVPSPVEHKTDESVAFDAILRFRDGHREYRRARVPPIDADGCDVPEDPSMFRRAAAEAGGTYRLITPNTLESKRVRILNSLRMLRFIAAARRVTLVNVRNNVLMCLKRAPAMTLQAIVDDLHDTPAARVLAAAFQLVGKARVQIEMDHEYVTLGSIVRAAP